MTIIDFIMREDAKGKMNGPFQVMQEGINYNYCRDLYDKVMWWIPRKEIVDFNEDNLFRYKQQLPFSYVSNENHTEQKLGELYMTKRQGDKTIYKLNRIDLSHGGYIVLTHYNDIHKREIREWFTLKEAKPLEADEFKARFRSRGSIEIQAEPELPLLLSSLPAVELRAAESSSWRSERPTASRGGHLMRPQLQRERERE